jgi:hypothetical protein
MGAQLLDWRRPVAVSAPRRIPAMRAKAHARHVAAVTTARRLFTLFLAWYIGYHCHAIYMATHREIFCP